MIQGPQTAVVVGPPGETIHPDKYGRVKVQFHWDRHGKKDADSSCWIRVSQNWGGGNWGGMNIPHVGQEVVVEFEEGDPDRPLITGRVYNAEKMPPLPLPENKTQSLIRDHGGNQLVMEGSGKKQQILLHSPHSDTTLSIGSPSPSVHRFAGSGSGSGPVAVPQDENAQLTANAIDLLDHYMAKNADATDADGPTGHFEGGFRLYTGESWYVYAGQFEFVHIGTDAYRLVGGKSHITLNGAHTLNINSTSDVVVSDAATETFHSTLNFTVDGAATEIFHDGLNVDVTSGDWITHVAGHMLLNVDTGWDANIKGDWNVKVKGDTKIEATGDAEITSTGTSFLNQLGGWMGVKAWQNDMILGGHTEQNGAVHHETTVGMHVEIHGAPHLDNGILQSQKYGTVKFCTAMYKILSASTKIGGTAMKILGV